jgi:hypothetical protein
MIAAVFDGQTHTISSDLTILFRPLDPIPVSERPGNKRKGYFQLNASVPFVADYETKTETSF